MQSLITLVPTEVGVTLTDVMQLYRGGTLRFVNIVPIPVPAALPMLVSALLAGDNCKPLPGRQGARAASGLNRLKYQDADEREG